MNAEIALRVAVDPALSLLPPRMASDAARAMLLSIGLQETRFAHRRQISSSRPALSFWQFEPGAASALPGVLRHPATKHHAADLIAQLSYPPSYEPEDIRLATEHNDVLAAGLARLLLWTLPVPLPNSAETNTAWRQYLEAWRPGQPHPDTWAGFYAEAWRVIL